MDSSAPENHSLLRLIVASGAAAALALLMSACEPVNPYPEYVGINILESRGVTAATGGAGYLDGSLPGFAFDYIELTELGAAEYGTSVGLPAGAPVFRLEVLNLLPDGDFEASTVGANPDGAPWVQNGTPTLFEVNDDVVGGVPGFGTNNYLEFDVAPLNTGALDLDAHLADGLVGSGVYHIQFEIVRNTPTSILTLDYGEGTTSYLEDDSLSWTFETPSEEQTDTPVRRFPTRGDEVFNGPGTFYASAAGTGSLYVGSPEEVFAASAGYVDNIRIGRLDILPHWALPLPAVATDGLELVPGTYRFRVWVKSEVDTQITPEPDGWNRFRAGQITIGANNVFTTYRQGDFGWDSNTWAELTYEFTLTPQEITQTPALTIQITPSSLDTPAVGSILISEPVLELVY